MRLRFKQAVHDVQLAEDLPGVSLALSLHAPNQELRTRIVPSARAYKLDRLMAAVDDYSAKSGQKARNASCEKSSITNIHAMQRMLSLHGQSCACQHTPFSLTCIAASCNKQRSCMLLASAAEY